MSIQVTVTLDNRPLEYQAVGLQHDTTVMWVATDGSGIATVDDAYAGTTLSYIGPVLFGGIGVSLSASGGRLTLSLEKGWTVPDSKPSSDGKVAVAVMAQNDSLDVTAGGYLLKNHKVSVESQDSKVGTIDTTTDGDGFIWLAESYVGTSISLDTEMANDDLYGGGWFGVCERGSIGTMYGVWDVLGGP